MGVSIILIAVPFFFGSILFEMLYGKLKGTNWYNFEDSITNLNLGIGSQAFNTLSKVLLLGLYGFIYTHFALFKLPSNIYTFIGCVIAFDFLYYWAHRLGHEWNLFWGAHIVHHQSQEYNLSVALRQSWFHNMLAFVIFLPIPFLGFDPILFGAAAGFVTLYQYWIHTQAIKSMGWFEWIFNSPAHHRVHHAINPQYLDKNYAAVFIIWDRMFGTFVKEEETPEYGTTVPIKSWNPVWANIHFYVEMWEGMKLEKGLFRKFSLLFRGPDYLGELLQLKSSDYKNKEGKVDKYRPKPSLNMQIYVFVQFLILTLAIFSYILHFKELSMFYKLTFLSLIVLTTLNCGAIMENRKWSVHVEIVRLLVFLLVYNILYYTQYSPWFGYVIPISLSVGFAFIVWVVINYFYTRNKLAAGLQ